MGLKKGRHTGLPLHFLILGEHKVHPYELTNPHPLAPDPYLEAACQDYQGISSLHIRPKSRVKGG